MMFPVEKLSRSPLATEIQEILQRLLYILTAEIALDLYDCLYNFRANYNEIAISKNHRHRRRIVYEDVTFPRQDVLTHVQRVEALWRTMLLFTFSREENKAKAH